MPKLTIDQLRYGLALAAVIVKATPTQADDQVFATIKPIADAILADTTLLPWFLEFVNSRFIVGATCPHDPDGCPDCLKDKDAVIKLADFCAEAAKAAA